ncbi:hypothetical protein ACFWY9_04280 [Amycolatopsis sp. NPDC059027]|uniref:hypothetical protein n=1 Tax=Amycolatopsis sp. NPDC059027 TaxID=3346709 RepID=UPI0036726A07
MLERLKTPPRAVPGSWFPGRFVGGGALILAPPIWFAGFLLRYLGLHGGQFTDAELDAFAELPFAAPARLASYVRDPALVTAGDALFVLGAILLFPAFVTLAHLAVRRCPKLVAWGGTLLVFGLFARAYFAGVDQTAFRLIAENGLDDTVRSIMAGYADISYGPWRVPVTASACQYAGGLLLGIGLWRSGVFGTGRTLVFLASNTIWMGVLKEAVVPDLVFTGLLALVLVPLGIQVLRDRRGEPVAPKPLGW